MSKIGGYVLVDGTVLCVHCEDQVRGEYAKLHSGNLNPALECDHCGEPLQLALVRGPRDGDHRDQQ